MSGRPLSEERAQQSSGHDRSAVQRPGMVPTPHGAAETPEKSVTGPRPLFRWKKTSPLNPATSELLVLISPSDTHPMTKPFLPASPDHGTALVISVNVDINS